MRETAERIHDELTAAGIEVLLYDQKARLGAMLADLDRCAALAGVTSQ